MIDHVQRNEGFAGIHAHGIPEFFGGGNTVRAPGIPERWNASSSFAHLRHRQYGR
jgi:hypothetical protein